MVRGQVRAFFQFFMIQTNDRIVAKRLIHNFTSHHLSQNGQNVIQLVNQESISPLFFYDTLCIDDFRLKSVKFSPILNSRMVFVDQHVSVYLSHMFRFDIISRACFIIRVFRRRRLLLSSGHIHIFTRSRIRGNAGGKVGSFFFFANHAILLQLDSNLHALQVFPGRRRQYFALRYVIHFRLCSL